MIGVAPQTATAQRWVSVVSIHDVMPDTLPQVRHCLDVCRRCGVDTIYLLVVPGVGWTPEQLSELRQWSDQGCLLAGHGWLHQAGRISGLHHRLHSILLSRQVAEHLALSEYECLRLMQRCHGWFEANDMPAPDLYVPPAWALGRMNPQTLATTGFRYIETLRGVLDLTRNQWLGKPMLGYEADTGFRVKSLRSWNAFNRLRARQAGNLRLAIHPSDFQYDLKIDLVDDLTNCHSVRLGYLSQ